MNLNTSVYQEHITQIITACNDTTIINAYLQDLLNNKERWCDELNDIGAVVYITSFAPSNTNTIYITQKHLDKESSAIELATAAKKDLVVLPSFYYFGVLKHLATTNTIYKYIRQANELNFAPIAYDELNAKEKAVFDTTDMLLDLIDATDLKQSIFISEKLGDEDDVLGLYLKNTKKIVIHRSQLGSLKSYAGTLIHECTHALSGYPDVDRGFEIALTKMIGLVVSKMANKID
jgi:hypothetical protein